MTATRIATNAASTGLSSVARVVTIAKPFSRRKEKRKVQNEIRLIDANALREEVKTLFWSGSYKSTILQLIDNAPTIIWCSQTPDGLPLFDLRERPQGKSVIKCQDCKYRVKEWREDKRMKEKGYWVYGCKHFGEIMGYWGFGGNDNEFCSDAEQKGGAE